MTGTIYTLAANAMIEESRRTAAKRRGASIRRTRTA